MQVKCKSKLTYYKVIDVLLTGIYILNEIL